MPPSKGRPKPPPAANGHADVLSEARRLHKRGFWVVPCKDKKPATSAGWDKTRLSLSDLEAALTGGGLNIAIALNQSDLIDVECDSDEAEANLQTLFGGEVPITPTSRSKRGLHRYFRRPPGLPEKSVIKLGGAEFRIGNGRAALSIVPPSVHPDGPQYEWQPGLSIHDVEPAELPPSVIDKLTQPVAKPQPAGDGSAGDIPEGQRNDTLFKLACRLAGGGLTPAAVEAALQAENAARCKPPLTTAEVAGISKSACSQSTQRPQKAGTGLTEETYSETLLRLAGAGEYWRTPDDKACVTIPRGGHREHFLLSSKAVRSWLAAEFYQETGKAAGTATMQDVLNVLDGKARFTGPEYPFAVRVAGHGGKVYLDLGDEDWRAAEIDAGGWRVVTDPPVRFRRTKSLLALPVPVPGGTVAELRPFVNVGAEHWPLVLGWLVAALRPTGPYPILKLLGEQGSAKTTSGRVLRALVDPNVAPVRSAPRGDRDLMIAASNGWLVCLDNLSFVDPELSDAFCRLATGGGFATRTLYENDEETIFAAQRPVMLNGIEDVGLRSDLIDRSLNVELPRIEPGRRKAEAAFWAEFEEARPRILGALLDAASAALVNLPAVAASKTEWPRMADFAQWAVAAEGALGLKPGEFLSAYSVNRETAGQAALESSEVVVAIFDMLKRKPAGFVGTAAKLLDELVIGQDTRHRDWPKNARALSGKLARLAPNLRQAGLVVEQDRKNNQKLWRIEPAGPTPPAAPSASSQSSQPTPAVLAPGGEGTGDAVGGPGPKTRVGKSLWQKGIKSFPRTAG